MGGYGQSAIDGQVKASMQDYISNVSIADDREIIYRGDMPQFCGGKAVIMQSNSNNQLYIGWAQTSITPNRPVFLRGQFYERISRYVHDPITATALVVYSETDQAILVSLDMVSTPVSVMANVRARLLIEQPDLDISKITTSATHTHTSICVGDDSLLGMYDQVFGKDLVARTSLPDNFMNSDEVEVFLTEKLTSLIKQAWQSRKPGGISYSIDYAAVAFNRRPVFKGGETIMYGVCSREDFLRLEGPADHTADMLYTWDLDGKLTGVAVNIPCPSQVMELHCFISADYWDSARDAIRERSGNIFILPICGAGGDVNPLDLLRISKTNTQALVKWGAQVGEVFRDFDMNKECQDIGDRIAEAVVRGYKKARNNIQLDAVFQHHVSNLSLPIRMVTENEYIESLSIIDGTREKFSPENKMQISDLVPLFKTVGTVRRWYEQQETTTYTYEMHVIRLGNIAIATNPFELFTEYGMRIKARSPAEQTFLAQLSNDEGGYLPTQAAVMGGSYSSTAASTTCGPQAGDMLVEETLRIINAMW